jgi:hypothetical protein
LLGAVKSLEGVKAAGVTSSKSQYHGGAEIRLDVGGTELDVVLAFQGAVKSDKDALSLTCSSSS